MEGCEETLRAVILRESQGETKSILGRLLALSELKVTTLDPNITPI
jgi:hypothetical protein